MTVLILVLLFTGVLSVCTEKDCPIIGGFTCDTHSYVPLIFPELTNVNGTISIT